ncbi:hypothetical protein HAHE_19620 [Haloferula helveola]|uniref:LamG-like jellyroll fold domain-containing protein n=1 Tax=Haloferula helveola TaxID=490095 RepID=A0ABM7RLP1_9BACT|nr:hypothetical protein HAHE_19620 [Haloferula helveola]
MKNPLFSGFRNPLAPCFSALALLFAGHAQSALIVHYDFNSEATLLTDSAGTRDLVELDDNGGSTSPVFVSTVTASNGTREGVVRFAGNVNTNDPFTYLQNNDGAFTLSSFTVAYWVRTDSSNQGGFKGIFTSGNSGEMQFDNHNGVYRGITDAGTVNFTETVPINRWDHIALTYDGTTTRWYYNGAEVANSPVAGNPDNSFQLIRLGGNRNLDNSFNGDMDDFRIYDNALSAGEIAGLAAIPEPSVALLACLGLAAVVRRRR